MKVRAILFAAVACLPAIAVNADATVLTGNALRNAVSGKTVYLKISGFELPIRYLATGTMVGSMGVVAASLAGRQRVGPLQVVDLGLITSARVRR